MENCFKVFFSWQSDTNSSNNRNFILNCINKAIKKTGECIEADRDTQGVSGSVNIENTIFKKIEECDAFIADVSFVVEYMNSNKKEKKIPNSNVMLELGYAASCLTWHRVILVMNEEYGECDRLPFDLRQHSVITYHITDGNKEEEKERLSNTLSSILRNFYQEGPVPKNNMSNIKLFGYNFSNQHEENRLIPYSIDVFPNYIAVISDLKEKVESLCKEIGDCPVEIRRDYTPIPEIGSVTQRFAAMQWNNSEFIDAVPYKVDSLINKLKDYFGLEYGEEYFSFGNLKIGKVVLISGLSGGPALNGTESEKKKRELYLELQEQIELYEVVLKLREKLLDYNLYPLVIYNDSLVLDDNIEIDIDVDNKYRFFDFGCLKNILSDKEIISFVSSGLMTKLFFNYFYSHRITTDSVPTKYPRKNSMLIEVDETIDSCNDEFENLVMNFYNTGTNYEYELVIEEMQPKVIKWASKLIVVEKTDEFSFEYNVKGSKSDASFTKKIQS